MRKILFNPRLLGKLTVYDFTEDRILIKEEGKDPVEITVSSRSDIDNSFKYTAEELRRISIVNQHLDKPMTAEEIDYMLTDGIGTDNIKPADVAARAGYRIEKKIVSI